MGVLNAITPFILGLIMLIYYRERRVYPGFGYWILASFGFAAGSLLISLRGVVPDFYSILLGNCINVYSEILIYEGIQLFYGRSPFNLWNYIIFGAYILLQSYFTYLDPDINSRIFLVSAVFLVLILRSASKLFQSSIPELNKTSRSAGYLFVITALFPLIRGIHALFQTEPIDLFQDEVSSWFSLTVLLSIVAWTFYFYFLNSARLELELEASRRHMEHIAMTDSLTRSYNRRHFDQHAEIEFQLSKRFNRSLSFLMLDMDRFKVINDSHGHDAGDRVLLFVSATIESEVRSLDVVARYGGDEFVIMLLDTNQEQANMVAERIRRAVEQSHVTGDFGELKITVSVGVSTVQPSDSELAMTLRRADTALYRAKNEGRNQVVFA